MVVSKIGLHDKDEDQVDELDDGEKGKISAEVTNDGAKQDVMTDVEVDFYFVDKDDEEYYIDTDIIPYIKVFVNKQRAINEGSQNYKNNEEQELLVVTTIQTTTPSFEGSASFLALSVMMVVFASMGITASRKGTRKKKEE